MCGDPYCPSCGPAQGNHKCPHCGMWSADGGCNNPTACQEADKLMVEAEVQLQKELDEAGKQFQKWLSENHPLPEYDSDEEPTFPV